MRQVINEQLEFGEVDISAIKFDPKSRDDIPRILRGLQYIYTTPSLRGPIFGLLEQEVSPKVDKGNGRPGMELWKILVLGVLRLDLNTDYDRIHDLANNHGLLRKMLGHGNVFDESYYNLQTIKDNISLLHEELLGKINEIVVNGGHLLAGKKSEGEALHGRCDSFVVETNVHYPTDTNLLFDAIRKAIQLTALLCNNNGITELRQSGYIIRQLKYAMRDAQKARRRSKANSTRKKEDNVIVEHQKYLDKVTEQLNRVLRLLAELEALPGLSISDSLLVKEVRVYVVHVERQIDQIERRVIKGETIAHEEKVFSIFEPHTEWISKGKAGVPVELGLRVCVMEDQHQFILHHLVMEKQTDDKAAIAMVEISQNKFPELVSVSFDKGFHSKENQEQLKKVLELAALPSKGKLSAATKALESTDEFRAARKNHSGVESAINALGVHGLDRCPDHGLDGFKRYVALAVVTRNIHRIGDILHKQEQKKLARQSNRLAKVANATTQSLAA